MLCPKPLFLTAVADFSSSIFSAYEYVEFYCANTVRSSIWSSYKNIESVIICHGKKHDINALYMYKVHLLKLISWLNWGTICTNLITGISWNIFKCSVHNLLRLIHFSTELFLLYHVCRRRKANDPAWRKFAKIKCCQEGLLNTKSHPHPPSWGAGRWKHLNASM